MLKKDVSSFQNFISFFPFLLLTFTGAHTYPCTFHYSYLSQLPTLSYTPSHTLVDIRNLHSSLPLPWLSSTTPLHSTPHHITPSIRSHTSLVIHHAVLHPTFFSWVLCTHITSNLPLPKLLINILFSLEHSAFSLPRQGGFVCVWRKGTAITEPHEMPLFCQG